MRVFVAVAAEQSFTQGGRRIGISNKQASKMIQRLEQELGCQLFNRTTRSVALTDIGRAYYERCQPLLDQFDEVEEAVKNRHRTPGGVIRVTAPTGFGEQILTPALAPFLRQYPEIQVNLNLTNVPLSLVDEGLDLAIRVGSPGDSTMMARKLAPMRLVFCAAPSYLVEHGRPQSPEDLGRHKCLIDSNFHSGNLWPYQVNGDIRRVRVSGPFAANTPKAACDMAVAGLGISLTPLYAAGPMVARGELELLFEENELEGVGVYALYPHNRHLSARVRVLVDYLADYCRDLPQ
ncbi:LysR family transcriptional regulator [Aestuariispira insulae]|nr:LysR family transcriptional regulator [Aestuariispira insulae]